MAKKDIVKSLEKMRFRKGNIESKIQLIDQGPWFTKELDKKYKNPQVTKEGEILDDKQTEIKLLQKELERLTEERDINKKPITYFANNPNWNTHL